MNEALYLNDSYLKECDGCVVSVKEGKYVILDRTIFYPRGGGQPHDTGKIIRGSDEFNVVFVGKFENKISHEVDKPGLQIGDRVKCVLNWERRYKLMRSHTAAHVLAAVMNKEAGVLITGNQLEEDKVRFDFNFEKFDRPLFEDFVAKANKILKQDIEVKIYTLPREKAMAIPGVVKLAAAFPPELSELRIVEIPGIDIQADGGTHVKNVNEVGQIELLKLENKGKNNRRIYFRVIH